jgi:hypothetical protein
MRPRPVRHRSTATPAAAEVEPTAASPARRSAATRRRFAGLDLNHLAATPSATTISRSLADPPKVDVGNVPAADLPAATLLGVASINSPSTTSPADPR